MKTEAFEELIDLADIGTSELSSAADQNRADVVRTEARRELTRRKTPITVDSIGYMGWTVKLVLEDGFAYHVATSGEFSVEFLPDGNVVRVGGLYSFAGVQSIGDLIDLIRLKTGKDIATKEKTTHNQR